jgi:hypothetical protein
VFLPSIINRMLQEGQEGALVTGICARSNNISCNTVKDFAMEYFNFHEDGTLRRVYYQKKALKDFAMEYFNFHEEGTLRRVYYQKKALLSCTAASAMPTKCNF